MVQTMPIVENAIKEVCTALVPETMVIADLGCSSGPNTLLFISNVLDIISGQCNKTIDRCDPMELQIFLNDLPGNDFNQLFSSLENLKRGTKMEQMGYTPPLYYISGLPKSYQQVVSSSKCTSLSLRLLPSLALPGICIKVYCNKSFMHAYICPWQFPCSSLFRVQSDVLKCHVRQAGTRGTSCKK